MRIEVGGLDCVMEGVLSMEYKDGRQKSVIYLAKSLDKTEKNYKIYNKEILAVIRELQN